MFASICYALPNTVFPDPNAHTHAHSAATVKLASPHWDSTYWPRKPIFLNLKTRHKHLWPAQWTCLAHVTLKLDRRPWKTIGHLFYALKSFEHHLITIFKIKMGLPSRNSQIGAKSILISVTLKCDPWPWAFHMVITFVNDNTPGNFMTIQWQEHFQGGATGRLMDNTVGQGYS